MSVSTTVKGKEYRIGTLSAMKQFHVVRRLSPVLVGLFELTKIEKDAPKPGKAGIAMAKLMETLDMDKLGKALDQIAQQIANMDDKAAEFIILTCLTVVERKQGGGEYAKVVADGQFMFEDIDMVAMLTLTAKVVKRNLSGFFDALPGVIPGATQT
ncbi:MAG: hypothetical protein CL942_08540 [Desulfovibrio sp.]|nr:hypothetical protein [Desulfovibrio sp.]|tara:strand:- start:525 stop:992 length:468 start_codon:yes stop_codon:yes gene_type:complete